MDTAIPTRSGIICTFEEFATCLSNFLTHCLARANSIGLTVGDAVNFHDIVVQAQDRPLSLQLTSHAGLLILLVAVLLLFILIVCGLVRVIYFVEEKLSTVVSPSATPFIGPGRARRRDNGTFSNYLVRISLWYVVIFVHH